MSVLQLNMQRNPSRAPTNEEIAANARVEFGDHQFVAAWYPQMGGYVGKCWIQLHSCGDGQETHDDGFDVFVYHDGEFPFDETRSPARLHHCSAEQFIEFGQLVQKLNAEDAES